MPDDSWSNSAYERIWASVSRRTGLRLPAGGRTRAEAAILRSMKAADASDVDAFGELVEQDAAVLDALADAFTVGETYFFREPEQLDFVRRTVLPEILRRRGADAPIRLWSAGCASGEEAYTLAILAHELGIARQTRILGTDIAPARLARAREGRYTRWSLRSLSPEVTRRYFRRAAGKFQLDAVARAAVDFRWLNLAAEDYPAPHCGIGGMDLILCRNVFIYFDPETITRVARRLLDSLSPGGWLLLGAADPPLTERVACQAVLTPAGLAYRRPCRGRVLASAASCVPAVPVASPLAQTDFAPAVTAVAPSAPAVAPQDRSAEMRDCYERRDYRRAAELARLELEAGADEPLPWITLVRALANRGELADAERACLLALERQPLSGELFCLHAQLLVEAGRPREAALAARQALYLDRGACMAHLALGQALAAVGDAVGARRSYANALRLLESLPPAAPVPGGGGAVPAVLASLARSQLRHAGRSA